jgi:uncharacterized protein involved in exopolysaccharide biosynthesis
MAIIPCVQTRNGLDVGRFVGKGGGPVSIEVISVLQTLSSSQPFRGGQPDGAAPLYSEEDRGEGLNFKHYILILKRRIIYFLVPFSLIAILGLYFVTTLKPVYRSEGKILVESQGIAPGLVNPVLTAAAGERIERLQQRVMTRDNLLSIASKFGLFPDQQGSGKSLLDLMQESIQIRLVEVKGATIAFTVGVDYENPELAMRVANEILTLILNEDARTRTGQATQAIKVLDGEVKGLHDELDATQAQISEIRQRPRDAVPEVPDHEKSQLAAIAALRTELIQKTSVYSDAHPAVVALKKRIAAMEKAATQSPPTSATTQSTQADDIATLQRQRQALEKRLEEANGKLAFARLHESLERNAQSERLLVIEQPTLPQKPLKSGRLKVVGIVFALAAAVGVGAIFAAQAVDRSIGGSHELLGVVDSRLIIPIPYILTQAEILRKQRGVILGAGILIVVLLGGLTAAALYWFSIDFSWFNRSWLAALIGLSK